MDVLVYKGKQISWDVLHTILESTDKRLLWAFVEKDGDIVAVCYDESRVIWMLPDDVATPEEVEL